MIERYTIELTARELDALTTVAQLADDDGYIEDRLRSACGDKAVVVAMAAFRRALNKLEACDSTSSATSERQSPPT